MVDKWKEIDSRIRAYLGLKHHLVGVRFINKGQVGENSTIAYCHMPRPSASQDASSL